MLTEGLPLLFGIPFSTAIFLALLFSSCGHFLLINTWMDGWMDGGGICYSRRSTSNAVSVLVRWKQKKTNISRRL